MQSVITFLREVRAEMSRVSWPTRQQTVTYTLAVIVMSFVLAILLGLFDWGFGALLQLIITR